MKIMITSLITEKFKTELIDEFPDIEFTFEKEPERRLNEVSECDVFMGIPSREVFLAADKIRWLHCPGTGIDKIMEIPEVIDSDVVVTNARGPHTSPMADHGMAMILTFTHRLRQLWDDQKEKVWNLPAYDQQMISLTETTMGILGVGGIGSAMGRRAAAFGIRVYGIDRDVTLSPEGILEVWGTERLDELLSISDWFVVAVPYTSDTHHLLDHSRMSKLKLGSRIIVLSRGGIVDERALIEGIENGSVAGAGLDVTEVEPLPQDSPLWDHPNIILSPHVSALTSEMWEGRRDIFKENLRRYLSNKPFLYACDKRRGY
ncbi:MAG: D-2-hydroxyacid dehydrogenase [SAR202 cluster bacterium]|jgi:phosphoglycerate dehydrogenase-like enzyme|nr:D-2-hydroxyacid dehydrogenase [SAR202 cluster bacterium]